MNALDNRREAAAMLVDYFEHMCTPKSLEVRKGEDFEEVLKRAQELGLAEPDPTFDIEGIDPAHKIIILAYLIDGF